MSKRKAKPTPEEPEPDPVVQEIAAAVIEERRDDTIILIVPSHDGSRPQKRIAGQDQWADIGLRLFSRLYGGATAFTALRGIWRSDDGTDLLDEPIMIQSLVKREAAVDEGNLQELANFARRMCRETNQECVAVICNDTIHFIRAH